MQEVGSFMSLASDTAAVPTVNLTIHVVAQRAAQL